MACDVVVVGGGVIGCSVAYHLLKQGASVAVVERGHLGAGASGAAAGMLAVQVETDAPDAFYDLCLASRERFPGLAAELLATTGIDIELVRRGILQPADEPGRVEQLKARGAWQRARGQRADWLDAAAVRQAVPELAAPLLGALYLPDDAQVESPRLVQALRAGIMRLGGGLHEGALVTGLLRTGDRVQGVKTTTFDLAAGAVVLAAGAWSGELAGRCGLAVPVFPVKGQLLAMQAPELAARPTLFHHHTYVVPKRDGRAVLGATQEPEAGFDARPTLGGAAVLATAAARLLPHLPGLPLVAHWAGLRPGTPDGWPLLGRVPGVEGLLLATGHFRNGVLLAPITGEIIAALLAGHLPPVDPTPFSPARKMVAQ